MVTGGLIMKIGVVGLGLIGGSLCKTIKKHTHESVFGMDINKASVKAAIAQEAIDGELTTEGLGSCDLVIIGLHPQPTIDFIRSNADNFKKGGIVIDTCGVKGAIVSAAEEIFKDKDVNFLGVHPMAGREFSGFDYAVDNLFDKASFIMTPTENTKKEVIDFTADFAKKIGFAKVVITDTAEHDSVIAFTSQLAHVVSNAYVKSPSILKQSGFSAGSFKDLTRVAKLNENMWTELFLMNREPLLFEINNIIQKLTQYQKAIEDNDSETLKELLKEGRELKEQSIANEVK